MSETAQPDSPARSGPGALKMSVIGLLLAAACGGGGFYAVQAGWIDPVSLLDRSAGGVSADIAYVAIDPIVVSLARGAGADHLRMTAQIEVDRADRAHVESRLPRVVDALNEYLRAVQPAQLGDAAQLVRLRAQMLRRVQMAAGEDRVRDLLVTEFVLD